MSETAEVLCPKCGGATWNNTLTKRNPKAPDYKCRDRNCDGAVWPPKGTPAPAPSAIQFEKPQTPSGGATLPYEQPAPLPINTRPAAAAQAPAASVPLDTSEVRARIDRAMVHAAKHVGGPVLQALSQPGVGDGPAVLTVDAARLINQLMMLYRDAGLLK